MFDTEQLRAKIVGAALFLGAFALCFVLTASTIGLACYLGRILL
jgi:hypothetical protein